MHAALRSRILTGISLCALILLNACGGGGGGGGGGAPVTPVTPVTPQADVFNWTGNTRLTVAASPTTGLLANDPPGTVITAADTLSTQGGAVNVVLASGAFTYDPPVGLQNVADTFTYTTSGALPTTVTVNLAERIWYIDNSLQINGDGTFGNPFNTLAAAETPVSDANDTIFVFTGVPAAPTDVGQNLGITLVTGQKLLGQGLPLLINGVQVAPLRPNPPVISNAGLAAGGDIPVVRLATGNEVAGFTILAAFNEGILALGGGGHNLHDNDFIFDANNGREGIRLLNVTGENFVNVNTITGSLRDGIKLANNEDQAGNAVAATPIVASVTMSRNTIADSAQDGINVNLDGAGTNVTLNVLTNTITNSGTAGANEGININSLGDANVTAVVSRNTISGSAQEAIDQAAADTSGMNVFVANNNLSNSVGPDFSAAIVNAGAAFCLELINNFNAAGNTAFLLANNGGVAADFRFFEVNNDTPAGPVIPSTPVAQGECAIPLDGAALFVANCAKCHTGNGLGLTTVKQLIGPDITNATPEAINLQLGNNGSMILDFSPTGRLRLTQQEITAIAAALVLAP